MNTTQFKRTFLLAAVLGAGAMTITPNSARADDATTQESSDGVKSNVIIPLDGATVTDAQGRKFTLSGSLHVTAFAKRQQDGVFIKAHVNAQGISLTAPDGTVFRAVGAINFQARTEPDGATFKAVANIGLIGAGQAPNFRLHVNLRGSVDQNGKVTFTRDTVELR